jgi:hypothetical protein
MPHTGEAPDGGAAATPAPHPIATMYERGVLDSIVEVARAVSYDFVRRPRHYRWVSEHVAAILSGFRASTGFAPDWPDALQRATIYSGLLDQTSQFGTASAALRGAVVAFSEQVSDRGQEMHRQAFQDSVIALRAYLNTLEGRVVSVGDGQTRTIFKNATEVLRSEEIARVFGCAETNRHDVKECKSPTVKD